MFNPDNRALHVTGTKHSSLEDNADYVVKSLGSDIPDELKGLPQVDANDITKGR